VLQQCKVPLYVTVFIVFLFAFRWFPTMRVFASHNSISQDVAAPCSSAVTVSSVQSVSGKLCTGNLHYGGGEGAKKLHNSRRTEKEDIVTNHFLSVNCTKKKAKTAETPAVFNFRSNGQHTAAQLSNIFII